MSMILLAVDSPKPLVTRRRSTPERFTQPEYAASPGLTERGTDSPVMARVSRLEVPSITVPSRGTFSPGFTRMISPTCTVLGSTTATLPLRSTFAVSGRMSRSSLIERLELPSAMPSKSSPTWKKSITKTASANWGSPPGTKPMSRAPMVAMDMRKSSSKAFPRATDSAASATTLPPATA